MAEFAGRGQFARLVRRFAAYLRSARGVLRFGFWRSAAIIASVEKIFLFACVIYIRYIISGFLVKPDWKTAAIYSVRPKLMLDSDYIAMLIGMVGTTIAPWMQFYLQSAVVEKGITAKDYSRIPR